MIGLGNDCLFPMYIPIEGSKGDFLRVRCGHCINCKAHKAQEWCLRLEMESQYWRDMCFITLTYNDESLPICYIDPHLFYTDEEIRDNPGLNFLFTPTHRHSDLCNFLKRLRKHLDHRIKYYAVGEYGTKGTRRSHLHILFFGLPYSRSTERLVKECWPFGHIKMTVAFPETCSYVAGYVQKKLYGKNKDFFRLPEFMRCSQHLGERWLYDHIDQFDDEHPFINWHGYKYGIPRQFRKILVKEGRLKQSSLHSAALTQKREYLELAEHVSQQGFTMAEFFNARIQNAIEKDKRKTYRRNTTGDI